MYEVDYFKIYIKYSKTDQAGVGQTVFIPDIDSVHQDPHMMMCTSFRKKVLKGLEKCSYCHECHEISTSSFFMIRTHLDP